MGEEMKFTKGPWQVNKKVKTSVEQAQAGQGINLIAQCEDVDGVRSKEEDQANARLIAAAPELLEALEMCIKFIEKTKFTKEFSDHFDKNYNWHLVQQALSKAKGE